MLKGALVGAVALTTAAVLAVAEARAESLPGQIAGMNGGTGIIVIKEAHIARLKSVLNLTPEQRPYWGPVESALRDIARQSRDEASAGGFVQRMGERASAVAGDAVRLKRLAAAARPLIKVLDDGQKRDAMMLARSLGFDRLVMAF